MKKFFPGLMLVVVTLTLAVTTDAEAQRFTKRRHYSSVGVSLNAMNYFGDIAPESDFTSLRIKSTRPNIGVNYTRRFHPRIAARGAFAWGRITGDDAKSASQNEAENLPRFQRNLNFRNDIKELSLVAMVDLFENRSSYFRRPDFSPYGFVGIAVFHHNPKGLRSNGEYVALQPLGTEGQHVPGGSAKGYPSAYSRVQIAIPFGLGVKYKLDRHWDLGFEFGLRKTFTDYLDDVSSNYADPADLTPLAAEMANRNQDSGFGNDFFHGVAGYQRGDRTDDDWYVVTGLNLTYILTPNFRGPKFR
jgi:hypothetical protein